MSNITNTTVTDKKTPNFFMAVLPILITMGLLIWLVVIKGGAPHIAIILGIAIASMIAKTYGYSWGEIRDYISKSASSTMQVIGILMVIGMLIGSWIISGTVPMLMVYGLDLLSPAYFLPSVVIIASLISLATGTSWGTIGTIGLALMGIGESLGIPAYLTAGAVVSGAYFGDKISPLSDTTNFCSGITGVSLYKHIKGMLPSTIPALLIGLVIYYFLGIEFSSHALNSTSVTEVTEVLSEKFHFTPLLLIPPVLSVIASVFKNPPIPSIFVGLIAGVVLAVTVQGSSVEAILETVMYGYSADTGIEFVDELLSKGGLDSMMWVSGLIILTVCYGGLLEKIKSVEVIVKTLVKSVQKIGTAVLANVILMIVLTFTTDLYVAYTIGTKIFSPISRGWGYSTATVSRVLESGGTMIDPLVPWSPAGVFVTSNLGVPTILYAPVSFVCWLAPVFEIIWGYTGYFMPKADEIEIQKWHDENRMIVTDGELVPINTTENIGRKAI